MATQVENADWLRGIEKLLGQYAAGYCEADLSPQQFYCRLDDQPDHLVPEHNLRNEAGEDTPVRPLYINPSARFTRDQGLPAGIGGDANLLKNFALQANLVWIKDPGSEALQPFWLSRKLARLLEDAPSSEAMARQLPPETRYALKTARVLVPEAYTSIRQQRWKEDVTYCAKKFKDKKYVPICNLIHPFHIAALRRYYRCLIRSGCIRFGDLQCPGRYACMNESVARFFHRQLTATVTAIAGEPVKPSYVYFASYQQGTELEAHIDREQCEFSVTLCLDYSPEPRHATPWPLRLQTPGGKVTVFQAIGNGLLYRGRELSHSRDRLRAGNTSTSLFFHYVREDFTGPLD